MAKYIIALYIRLSLEDVKYDSCSIQNQYFDLMQYAESLKEYAGAEVLQFVDNGYSGTNFERPAVQELLELVREKRIDCIIVRDFTRFGRNSMEMGYFIEQVFPLYRTRFISVNDAYDSDDYKGSTGGIEVAFKYLISEYYSKDLSDKSKTAKYTLMRRGEYRCKTCPYGYKSGKDKQMEIDEEAARIVRMIFRLSIEGNSAQDIVKSLYKEKIPTPGEYKASKGSTAHDISKTHGIWQRTTVLRILSDERYTGDYIIGKTEVVAVGSNRHRKKDKSEWIVIPDYHPAIISKATFQEAQEKALRFSSKKVNRNEHPLRGKVFCGCCDHALIRNAKKVPVFYCRHSKVDESFACHGLEITEQELESLLFDIISKQAEVVLKIDNVTQLQEYDFQMASYAKYSNQIMDCEERKKELYKLFAAEEIALDEYSAGRVGIDSELADLRRIASTLAVQTSKLKSDTKMREDMQTLAKDVQSKKALTRGLAEMLIDKVNVSPDNQINVEWRVKDFF